MKKQGFLLGSAILMVSMLITKVLGLIYKIPLTNILGGEGMSYYSSAYSIFMPVFAISVTGITTALSKIISENLSFKRYSNAIKIKRCATVFFLLSGIVFTLLSLLSGYLICVYILHSRQAFLSVAAISPSIFFASVMSVQRGFFEGGRNMIPTCVSEVIESILKVLFGIGGAYLALFVANKQFLQGGTVFGIPCETSEEVLKVALPYISAASLLGVSLSTAIATLYLLFISHHKSNKISFRQQLSDPTTDKATSIISFIVALAIPMALSCLITNIVSIVDMLTIQPIIKSTIEQNPESISQLKGCEGIDPQSIPAFLYGSFSGLALTVFSLVPSLTSMLGKSALPNISHYFAQGDLKSVCQQSQNTLFITNLISLPAGLGIAIFSNEILTLLFSGREAEVEASCQSLSVLGFGVLFISLTVTSFSLLQSIGKEKAPIYILLSAVVIKIVLNLILVRIPSLSICGAAISTVAFYIITAVTSTAYYFKVIGCKICFFENFIKPLYASINCIMGGVLSNNCLKPHIGSTSAFLVCLITSVIIYIFSVGILYKMTKNSLKLRFLP
ncbi:MAG: polysaccharide biosynthesis protein [Ruminococcus sp.]|nr:polysaccharide biosynthesis protein [Ruminococcus sp.]